eukprot:677414-Prymnesium_polylepis.1
MADCAGVLFACVVAADVERAVLGKRRSPPVTGVAAGWALTAALKNVRWRRGFTHPSGTSTSNVRPAASTRKSEPTPAQSS